MSALDDRIARGVAQHGDRFDPTPLLAGKDEYGSWYAKGARVRIRREYPGGEVWERTGTISTTTGWVPAWMLVHRSNAHGSSDLLDPARDRVVAVKVGRSYRPVAEVYPWMVRSA